MSVSSAAFIDLLPDLRRYALALIGERVRADDLVELCLEQVLANQATLDEAQVRLVTFALFDRLHEADRLDLGEPAADPAVRRGNDGFHGALRRLPVDERKALLLSGMAHFSRIQVAAILRTTPPVAAARAATGRDRLRRSLARSVLVIETEPVVALSLAQVVRHMGHRLSGIAPTRVQALARLADDSAPDLILAGVHRHGDSIAIVRDVLRARPLPVVFIVDRPDDRIEAPPRDSLMIAKPLARGVLEAAVRRLLDAR